VIDSSSGSSSGSSIREQFVSTSYSCVHILHGGLCGTSCVFLYHRIAAVVVGDDSSMVGAKKVEVFDTQQHGYAQGAVPCTTAHQYIL
jgi:hypothetical protein